MKQPTKAPPKKCVVMGCERPRWRGEDGAGLYTLCEQHQRENWARGLRSMKNGERERIQPFKSSLKIGG